MDSSVLKEIIDDLLKSIKEADVPIVISIDGNISAGKSTLLKILSKHIGEENIELVLEPLSNIQSLGNSEIPTTYNVLQEFYKNPSRWAYFMQTIIFFERAMEHQKLYYKNGIIRIMERCALGDFVFPKTLYENGEMSEMEWIGYNNIFMKYVQTFLPRTPNLIIYLSLNPEMCFERMKKRNRTEETGVSLEYLTQLHNTHEKWMPEERGKSNPYQIPYVRISSEIDYTKDEINQITITIQILKEICNILPQIIEERKTNILKQYDEFISSLNEKEKNLFKQNQMM